MNTPSPESPPPILVCRGRFPTTLGGASMLAALLGPLIGTGLLFELAHGGAFPWLTGSLLGDLAKGANPIVVAPVSVVVGFAAAWIVGAWFERRVGEVAIFERGIRWLVRQVDTPDVVPWERYEGFRDTPHPWVEVLSKKGAVRTIPVRDEIGRDRLLEALARFLPDLGRPVGERKPRAA